MQHTENAPMRRFLYAEADKKASASLIPSEKFPPKFLLRFFRASASEKR
jgi:hypothetical protein